jgi:hypothetical protein
MLKWNEFSTVLTPFQTILILYLIFTLSYKTGIIGLLILVLYKSSRDNDIIKPCRHTIKFRKILKETVTDVADHDQTNRAYLRPA